MRYITCCICRGKEVSIIQSNFYDLDQKTWEVLFNLGSPREFNPGDIIYLQDEESLGLVCLQQGRIKNSVFFPGGTEKTLCILEAPSITGETAVIDGGRSICSSTAMTKTKVIFIPRDKAQQFLLSNPNLMRLVLKTMARKIRSMLIQAQDMASNIPQRLARMLLNCNKYGVFTHQEEEARLTITHDELASFLGTTRPIITKHLTEFTNMGLIEKGRGYITIKDHDGLKKVYDVG